MPDDLFGATPPRQPEIHGQRRTTKARGYAGQPGRGPVGETCNTCDHLRLSPSANCTRRYKCGLTEKNWTHGRGSDVLVRSPACQYWKPDDE